MQEKNASFFEASIFLPCADRDHGQTNCPNWKSKLVYETGAFLAPKPAGLAQWLRHCTPKPYDAGLIPSTAATFQMEAKNKNASVKMCTLWSPGGKKLICILFHAPTYCVASKPECLPLSCVVLPPVSFVHLCVVQAQLFTSPFCVFYFVPIVGAQDVDVQSWSVMTAEPHISTYGHWKKKRERKKIAATLFVPVGILFALFFFQFSFFVVQCPLWIYVPDIGSVCSFKHLLLHSCLSQRSFFFFFFNLLLVEWWDAYFGHLHCAYSSETFFTYLWRGDFFGATTFLLF